MADQPGKPPRFGGVQPVTLPDGTLHYPVKLTGPVTPVTKEQLEQLTASTLKRLQAREEKK